MGYAIESFRRSWGTVTDHPTLIVGIGGAALLGSLVSSLVSLIPMIGPLLSWVVVTPVLLAAMLSMAAGALDGTPTYGDLRAGVADHWTSLVGAYAAVVGISIALGFAAITLLGAALLASGDSPSSVEGGAVPSIGPELAVAFGAIGLVVAFVLLVVQFVDVSIVVGGAGPLEAFGVSWRVVRSEPVSVLGYSLLRGLVMFVPIALVWALSFAVVEAVLGQLLLAAMGLAALGSVVVGPVVAAFGAVFHVTYFDRLDRVHDFSASEPDAEAYGDAGSWGADAESSA